MQKTNVIQSTEEKYISPTKQPISQSLLRLLKRRLGLIDGVLTSNKRTRASYNPLRMDPTRTTTLRRKYAAEMRYRFKLLKKEIRRVIVDEDVFGLNPVSHNPLRNLLTVNVPSGKFRFHSTSQKQQAFLAWLKKQIKHKIIGDTAEKIERAWWRKYAEEGYKKGGARAFDDVQKSATGKAGVGDFYEGTRDEFLRSSFGRPVQVEKIKVLAARTFTDLMGVTEAMSTSISRTLLDGLVRGDNPRTIAEDIEEDVDGIGSYRAEMIARTETIRAHAEGQLDAMEAMGIEQVGVMVEWSTAGDERVCPACEELEGVVLTLAEAHNKIPMHPNAVFAGSSFASYGECQELVRAWYDGPAIVLTLRSGKRGTTIGPNHPIMTKRGMVLAAQLREGDEILYDNRLQCQTTRVDSEKIPSVENVFESYLRILGNSGIVTSASDLHGDIVFCKGKVQAIRPTGSLLFVLDSLGVEKLREEGFTWSDSQLSDEPSFSSGNFARDGIFSSPSSSMGSRNLFRSFRGTHSRPLQPFCLTGSPNVGSRFIQDSVEDGSTDFEMIGGLPRRVSSCVEGSNFTDFFSWEMIHRVSLSKYVGWAFDATTATSLYYSDSFVVSNCRCSFLPANVGEDSDDQIRGKKDIDDAFEGAVDILGGPNKTMWQGADFEADAKRPQSILNQDNTTDNAFCPTGPGGGVDPSCGSGDAGGKSDWASPTASQLERGQAVFKKITDGPLAKYMSLQMRGADVTVKGEIKYLTPKSKLANLRKIKSGLDEIRENDPEAFDVMRQWGLADEFSVKSYADIPETVVLYRGHTEGEHLPKMVNVTHKMDVAESFGSKMSVYTIHKDDIGWTMQGSSSFNEGEILLFDTSKIRSVITNIFCPTGFGRRVKYGTPTQEAKNEERNSE